mmetsp:Transcript_73165/g.214429  ORF Transcript_73165/g.214429 Transcript_73165/m.214429 type:complete len:208 (+) Transcript_73165:399-1022(+)
MALKRSMPSESSRQPLPSLSRCTRQMKWQGQSTTVFFRRGKQRPVRSSTSLSLTWSSLRSSFLCRKGAAQPGRGTTCSTTPSSIVRAPPPSPQSRRTPTPPATNDGIALVPSGRGSKTSPRIWRLSPAEASHRVGMRPRRCPARRSSWAKRSCVAGGRGGAKLRLSEPSRVGSSTANSAHESEALSPLDLSLRPRRRNSEEEPSAAN